MTSNLQDDQHDYMSHDYMSMVEKQQSLMERQQTFAKKIQRDDALFRLRLCYGWVVLILLPAVAVFSGVIIANYKEVPTLVLNTACAALFVDVLGLVIAAYKTLLPRPQEEQKVEPKTKMPDSLPGGKLTE